MHRGFIPPSDALRFGSTKLSYRAEEEGRFESMEDVLRRHKRRVLAHTKGTLGGPDGADELLQIKPTTLRSRLQKLGMSEAKPGG
jgi:formate hydrogenlyase transcriptional activator